MRLAILFTLCVLTALALVPHKTTERRDTTEVEDLKAESAGLRQQLVAAQDEIVSLTQRNVMVRRERDEVRARLPAR